MCWPFSSFFLNCSGFKRMITQRLGRERKSFLKQWSKVSGKVQCLLVAGNFKGMPLLVLLKNGLVSYHSSLMIMEDLNIYILAQAKELFLIKRQEDEEDDANQVYLVGMCLSWKHFKQVCIFAQQHISKLSGKQTKVSCRCIVIYMTILSDS